MLIHQPLIAMVILLLFAAPWSATADTLVVENRSTKHKKARITCFHKSAHKRPFYVDKVSAKEVARVPVPQNLTQAFCLGLYGSNLVTLYDVKQDHERCKDKCSIVLLNNGYHRLNEKTKKWELIPSRKTHVGSPKVSPSGLPAAKSPTKLRLIHGSRSQLHAESPGLSSTRSSRLSHAKSPKVSPSGSPPAKSPTKLRLIHKSRSQLHAESQGLLPTRSSRLSHAKSPAKSPKVSPSGSPPAKLPTKLRLIHRFFFF